MLTVVIVIIVILVIGAIAAAVMSSTRRRRLQQRFGPEYDRLVSEHDSKLKAEAELSRRERRVNDLNIRPLEPAARERYKAEWATIQERFVDAPQGALVQAQNLVVAVMNERGYPTEHRDQLLADLSVDHAAFVDHYRAASDISERAADGTSSTEDLRQAVIHYRVLFEDLLGQPADNEVAAADRGLAPNSAGAAADSGRVSADPGLAPADSELPPAGTGPATAETGPVTAETGPATAETGPAEDTQPDPADPASEQATAADPRRSAWR
jgi:hypothetical protein